MLPIQSFSSDPPFPVKITAVAAGSGSWSGFWQYAWTEQSFDPATGGYVDAQSPRTGAAAVNPLLEVNNLHLTNFPFFAWVRFRAMLFGQPTYEFDATVAGTGTNIQPVGGTAVPGTSFLAAREDHVHPHTLTTWNMTWRSTASMFWLPDAQYPSGTPAIELIPSGTDQFRLEFTGTTSTTSAPPGRIVLPGVNAAPPVFAAIGAGELVVGSGPSLWYSTSPSTWAQLAESAAVVNSITGTAGQIDVAGTATVPVLSLDGPHDFTTLTDHGVLVGSGSSPIDAVAVLTNGQLLVGQSAADPLPKTLSGDATLSAAGALALTPSTDIAWNSHKITGLTDPSAAQDAATKAYVDAVAQGLSFKPTAQAATTTTLPTYTYLAGVITFTATGTETIDGHLTAVNERVLVKNETGGNKPYNGLYKVTTAGAGGVAGIWTRDTAMDASAEFGGAVVAVENGTTNADTIWVCSTDSPTVGVTDITFVALVASGSGTVTSVSGTANQVSVATGTTTPVISLTGPHGFTTETAHGILLGQGTSAITALAVGTNGQIVVGQSAADPAWATMSGDATLSSSGALTIAADAVTFAKFQNITQNRLLGRESAGGTGDMEEITLGGGIALNGAALGTDPNALTALTAVDQTADLSVIWDTSASAAKKVAPVDVYPYLLYEDQKTSGTNGGTFTSGAWRTRDINTEVTDTHGHGSVGSNQITLDAGTYEYLIFAPGAACDQHQVKLYNATDAADIKVGKSAFASSSGSGAQTDSVVQGRFTIAAGKALEVRHQCTTTKATNGFGVAGSFGTEVYTSARFTKVG